MTDHLESRRDLWRDGTDDGSFVPTAPTECARLEPPMERPTLPALAAWFERLSQRSSFLLHGKNGTP